MVKDHIVIGINIFLYICINITSFNLISFILLQIIFQLYFQFSLYLFKYRPHIYNKETSSFCGWVIKILINQFIYCFIVSILDMYLSKMINMFILLFWIILIPTLKKLKIIREIRYVVIMFLIFYNFYFISSNINTFYGEERVVVFDKNLTIFFLITLRLMNLFSYEIRDLSVKNLIKFNYEVLVESLIFDFLPFQYRIIIFTYLFFSRMKIDLWKFVLLYLLYFYTLIFVPIVKNYQKEEVLFLPKIAAILFIILVIKTPSVLIFVLKAMKGNPSDDHHDDEKKKKEKVKKKKKVKCWLLRIRFIEKIYNAIYLFFAILYYILARVNFILQKPLLLVFFLYPYIIVFLDNKH